MPIKVTPPAVYGLALEDAVTRPFIKCLIVPLLFHDDINVVVPGVTVPDSNKIPFDSAAVVSKALPATYSSLPPLSDGYSKL